MRARLKAKFNPIPAYWLLDVFPTSHLKLISNSSINNKRSDNSDLFKTPLGKCDDANLIATSFTTSFQHEIFIFMNHDYIGDADDIADDDNDDDDRVVEAVDDLGDPKDNSACMLVQTRAQPHLLLIMPQLGCFDRFQFLSFAWSCKNLTV